MSSCEKYQELISRMIDGDLSAREEAELARHLDGCPTCAALFDAFSAVSRQIGSDLEEPPAALRENVMAVVRREEIRRKNRIPTAIRGVLSIAAVAALVVGVYWGVSLSQSSKAAAVSAAAFENGAVVEKAMLAEEAADAIDAGSGAPEESVITEEAAAPQAAENSFSLADSVPADEATRDALAEAPMAAPAALPEEGAEEPEDEVPAWDLSAWDVSLLWDLLGGKPTELDPEELEPALLGRIVVRDKDAALSVPVFSRDGVLYYLDPLSRTVYQAELSPSELLDFLGETD